MPASAEEALLLFFLGECLASDLGRAAPSRSRPAAPLSSMSRLRPLPPRRQHPTIALALLVGPAAARTDVRPCAGGPALAAGAPAAAAPSAGAEKTCPSSIKLASSMACKAMESAWRTGPRTKTGGGWNTKTCTGSKGKHVHRIQTRQSSAELGIGEVAGLQGRRVRPCTCPGPAQSLAGGDDPPRAARSGPRRARHLVHLGGLSAACRPCPCNEATPQELRARKKPTIAGPFAGPGKVPRAALPDTAELLRQLLARGAVPPAIASALGLGRLVALTKPSGRVRGVVVSDFLHRLARSLAQQYAAPIQEVCSPHQFALFTRSGTDSVARVLSVAAELGPTATIARHLAPPCCVACSLSLALMPSIASTTAGWKSSPTVSRCGASLPLTQLLCPASPAGALVARRSLKPACGRSALTPSSFGPTGAASLSSPLRSVASGARKLRPSSASSLELGRVKSPFPSAPPRLPPPLVTRLR